MASAPPRLALSELEVLVLAGIASGATNEEIAEGLHYSPNYIKDVVLSARARLGANDRAHAAALAVAFGIVRPVPSGGVPPAPGGSFDFAFDVAGSDGTAGASAAHAAPNYVALAG